MSDSSLPPINLYAALSFCYGIAWNWFASAVAWPTFGPSQSCRAIIKWSDKFNIFNSHQKLTFCEFTGKLVLVNWQFVNFEMTEILRIQSLSNVFEWDLENQFVKETGIEWATILRANVAAEQSRRNSSISKCHRPRSLKIRYIAQYQLKVIKLYKMINEESLEQTN